MIDAINISTEEKKDIEELITTVLLIPKEDRAILLPIAQAFKIRSDITNQEGQPRQQAEKGR